MYSESLSHGNNLCPKDSSCITLSGSHYSRMLWHALPGHVLESSQRYSVIPFWTSGDLQSGSRRMDPDSASW